MTLATVIDGTNLTAIRTDASSSSKYWAQQFLVAVPDVVVVQFNPNSNITDSVFADIPVGTVGSGSMSNIKSFMTVIFSTTTDYSDPRNYRTYIRKVSGTSTLYIGACAQALTTSHYVTVLNTYDVFERPRMVRNGTEYGDWDISFRRLLPVETALPSAVVLIDGETQYDPVAVPLEIDNDATSSFTHAWESSNANDVIDADGTTASPEWTLEADAHRWIRYTFTDSNGNSNLRVISIWTIPKDLSSVVKLGFIGESADVADIQGSIGREWTCTIPAYSDISDLTAGTFVAVFTIETIAGTRGSLLSNIDAVGYLGNETTVTRGSDQYGAISETRFEIDTLSRKLFQTPVPTLSISDASSPNTWGEIEAPTPVRALVYLLSEHTTYLHLCALSVPSNHTDYQAPGEFFTSEAELAYDAAQYEADAMAGIIQFGRDGIIDMSQNLVELDDTARDAADTIIDLVLSDFTSEVSIERQPIPTLRFQTLFAGSYDVSEDDYRLYQSFTPTIPDIRGVTTEERTNIVLTSDTTEANAQAEFAERSANLFAALNPTDVLRGTLKDAWRVLTPDVGAWVTVTLAASDTARGIAYTTSTRWQLLEIGYAVNNERGDNGGIPIVMRRETQFTGATIDVAALETDSGNLNNALPGVLPPFSGGNLDLTDGTWFDSFDFQSPTDLPPPAVGCEVVGWRPILALGTETDQAALTGEYIDITVQGFGRLQTGSTIENDLTATQGNWITIDSGSGHTYGNNGAGGSGTILSGSSGSYSGGVGFVHGDMSVDTPSQSRLALILIDLGAVLNISDMFMTYDLTKGNYSAGGNPAVMIRYATAGVAGPWTTAYNLSFTSSSSGTDLTATFNDNDGIQARYVQMFVRSSFNTSSIYTGVATITAASITGASKYGDALYEWTADGTPAAYGTDKGLLINASQPSGIPPYNASHEYYLPQRPISGSGAVALDFESPYSLNSMENFAIQALVCFLGVP